MLSLVVGIEKKSKNFKNLSLQDQDQARHNARAEEQKAKIASGKADPLVVTGKALKQKEMMILEELHCGTCTCCLVRTRADSLCAHSAVSERVPQLRYATCCSNGLDDNGGERCIHNKEGTAKQERGEMIDDDANVGDSDDESDDDTEAYGDRCGD